MRDYGLTLLRRILRMACGVTALDFSLAHPNLLAVGFYDGTVAIYDMRKDTDQAVLESGQGAGKHMDAVWQVKWVEKGSEKGERLVSISTDGRVTEWSTKKGLTFTDLILLKRVSNPSTNTANKGEGGEGIISRQASGLCFDFPYGDNQNYLAGTEDGIIHRCSCSYNEQVALLNFVVLSLACSCFRFLMPFLVRTVFGQLFWTHRPCVQDSRFSFLFGYVPQLLCRLEHQVVESTRTRGMRAYIPFGIYFFCFPNGTQFLISVCTVLNCIGRFV
jgi:hypothetical protein